MCDSAPRQWTPDEATSARAGGRAHALRGRIRARGAGAPREPRCACAGDAHRRTWAPGRATSCSTRSGGAPSSRRSSACRRTTPTIDRDRLFAQVKPDDRRRLQGGDRGSGQGASRLRDRVRIQARQNRRVALDGIARPRRVRRRRHGDNAVRAGHRHHRSTPCRRSAAGSGSPQGRIPRHARPRAAQSARADQLGPAHPAASAKDDAQRSTALEIMERQVRQMVRLVDDLLDVARITTGKVEVRREPLDLAVAIRDAVETSRTDARRARAAVHRARAATAGVRQRRSHAARSGVREPAQQQREVQRTRPADLDRLRPRGRARRWSASRDAGMGIHPRDAAARVRHVPPGRSDRRPIARRPRHRPVARQAHRRDARRHGDRPQRRPRSRQRVRGPASRD